VCCHLPTLAAFHDNVLELDGNGAGGRSLLPTMDFTNASKPLMPPSPSSNTSPSSQTNASSATDPRGAGLRLSAYAGAASMAASPCLALRLSAADRDP